MPKPRDAAACGRFSEAGASLKIVALWLACARQMSDPGQERGIAGNGEATILHRSRSEP